MMKLHLHVFFITCFFCCVFVTCFPVPTLPFPTAPDQVEILLAFKNDFPSRNCDRIWEFEFSGPQFYGPNISSWTRDAKSFDGVSFDNETGAVIELDLRGACISGTIQANSSLFRFQHLRYLNLSSNHFDSSSFPAGFGRLTNLESLDLSQNGFIGEVPSSISNLNHLTTLNLSYNKLTGRFPHIHKLALLSFINLSYNHFSETIPSSLFTMPFLSHLDLRQNHLKDPLQGMISSATSKLEYLDMAKNLLSCRILEPISKLANLKYLDLSFQNTTYTINFVFLAFKSLEYLDLSGNSVSMLNAGSTNLQQLILSSCNITEFPMFIRTLRNLWELDISNNRLKGKVPDWLWNLPSLSNVNISHNSLNILEGSPTMLLHSSLTQLDLSSNTFHGSFPIIPPTIQVMSASNNNYTGDIPLTLCNVRKLSVLDLSNNNFSGSIPPCLISISPGVLKLRNNNLTGRLPDMFNKSGLVLLDVGSNHISGKLPRSLVNCTSLVFLNVESNRITDTFPFWLKALPNLEVIVLRSNRFYGPITSPENHLSFSVLRIIDLSDNKFHGSIPRNYFVNWSSPLINIPQGDHHWPDYTGFSHSNYPTPLWYYPSIHLRNKGRNMVLEKIPQTCTTIDFSGNRLGGEIPESIGLLKSLIVLDLSNNRFTGHIPSSLAKLTQLESLDLSRNQLSGRIPQELSVLTFLAYINMAHNKLTGQIPQSTQIGGQPKSSFEDNIDLCGLPLQETCFMENVPSTPPRQQPKPPEQEQRLNWRAAAIGYGPGVLFGLAIGQVLASYKPVLFFKLFRL